MIQTTENRNIQKLRECVLQLHVCKTMIETMIESTKEVKEMEEK